MEYTFFLSCDVDLKVRVRIENLEGSRRIGGGVIEEYETLSGSIGSGRSDIHACCQLYVDDVPIGPPARTRDQPFNAQCRWNEWLTFPVKYKDLSANARIAITVWEMVGPRRPEPVGCSVLPLFGKRNTLKKGRKKLQLERGNEANETTPLRPLHTIDDSTEMDRLEKLIKQYDRREIPSVEWLDRLSFRQIERINQQFESKRTDAMYLFVELPTFEFPVVFHEQELVTAVGGASPTAAAELVLIEDADLARDNPVENKQHKLARSLHRGLVDRLLKPNVAERKRIEMIVNSARTKALSNEDKDLLWKYRFSLTREKKALTKFLKCVDFSDAAEAKQAIELMAEWAPCDIEDALELLSASFLSDPVREYAVGRLDKADNEEVQSYLLQLVQALRYESRSEKSPLALFLTARAVSDPTLANFFYWYVTVELEDKRYDKLYRKVLRNLVIAVQRRPGGAAQVEQFNRQEELVAQLSNMYKELRESRESRPRKMERLSAMLTSFRTFQSPLCLPLNPSLVVTGLIPEDALIFKSAMSPLGISFTTTSTSTYSIIFKSGDDLRQDQLVIQVITLMDKLLKKENLDLKLTPYRVLATSTSSGMVEYVPSMSLGRVLAENRNDIHRFFQKHNPCADAPYGINPDVIDNFVKSSAGYCVISYILGIGDRHLDNLMLTTSGCLFHIDFGYLLGRDPKPLPPPMKLCREMVQGLGGARSTPYERFRTYCAEAYNILRKSAALFANLLRLMAHAGLPDVDPVDPDKSVHKLLERFHVEMTDEQAVQFMQALIDESVNALFPDVVDALHRWRQYWTA